MVNTIYVGMYAILCDELAILLRYVQYVGVKTSTDCCCYPFLKSYAYRLSMQFIMTLKWYMLCKNVALMS